MIETEKRAESGNDKRPRVGILTFLHNDNYGSTLQAYALQKTVESLGYACEHLDYQPDVQEKVRNLLHSRNSPSLLLEGLRKKGVRAAEETAREKHRAIRAFDQRYLRLSSPCSSAGALRETARDLDILICGSDQIWNPVWMNPAYFLSFADKGSRKIAYAPSLGVRSLPSLRKQRMIRELTADFKAISVREEEGASLMEAITGRRPDVMPDPVCLISREEWENLAGSREKGEAYLLCYLIGENPDYPEQLRKAVRETGLRPLVMPVTGQAYALEAEHFGSTGPEAFLQAIRGAKMLLTDSFHGLVFATIFGVPVQLLRRYSDLDPENKNSRVDHFLRLMKTTGLDALRNQGREWLRIKLREQG